MRKKEHVNGCDCFECGKKSEYWDITKQRDRLYKGDGLNDTLGNYTGQVKVDFADKPTQTADYYINAQLKALKPVTIYTNTSAHNKGLVRNVTPPSIVGEVYSWKKDENGNLWWQLKEGGFVKHGVGLFDPKIAVNSSSGKQAEIKEALAAPSFQVGGLSKFNEILGAMSKHLITIVIFLLLGFILLRRA